MEGGGPAGPRGTDWRGGLHRGGGSAAGGPYDGYGGWHAIPPGYPGHPGWAPYPLPTHPAIPFLATTGDRVGAHLIDLMVILVLMIPVLVLIVVLLFGFVVPEAPFALAPLILFPAMLLPILVQLGYVVLTEGRTGQSLGKRAVGIRVVKVDGRPIAWHDAVVRWVCLVVDNQPTLGVLGLVLVSTRPLKQRVGDLAAGTIVVRA